MKGVIEPGNLSSVFNTILNSTTASESNGTSYGRMDAFIQTPLYLLEPYNVTSTRNDTTVDEHSGPDGMSILWYLVSFGTLIVFFLLLSFSEFCCKKKTLSPKELDMESELSPPPPYELFAPPNYDSLFRSMGHEKKRRLSIFVIPVHEKSELSRESPLEFGEVIRRNPMGDGEVVTPPPPP